jgi:hypothetical protein
LERYEFNMADRPWQDVINWLTRRTGLPVVGSGFPIGRFAFDGPRGRKYTIPEIMTIINKELLRDFGKVLIRHKQAIHLLPADEPFLLGR